MANAEVYGKWSTQGDGNRAAGGWGRYGSATSAGGGGGINLVTSHAERVAWKTAWPEILKYVKANRANFPLARYEVKFWVDQQICPTCQKWMIIEVISHLKQLKLDFPSLIVELYAEVVFAGVTRRVRVQQTTVWPVEIGNLATYSLLPMDYNS